MKVFDKIPYYIPFTFTSVDDDQRLDSMVSVPYNVAIYGISITPSISPQTSYFAATLQFLDYTTGDTLFDEPLQNLCLQTDVRTYWKLPSKWFVRKNTKIICSLNAMDDVTATTLYITLLAHVTDVDPNPGVQPFVYSFPISVGFQDNVTGATSVTFGQGLTGTLAKQMLHDFDIHSIALDAFGFGGVGAIPSMSLQISTERKKLFDRFIINGCAGGGSGFCQGDTFNWLATSSNLHGFPADNVQQYKLPQPERVRKGDLVRVDISPSPTYLGTDDIHTDLNEFTCMALIGNHIA